MQQGSSATGTAGASATTTLTDEQILGLEPGPASDGPAVAQGAAPALAGAGPEDFLSDSQPETASGLPPPQTGGGAPRATSQDATPGAAEPEWLKALDAQPQAAAEARRWREAAREVASLDADYFSAEPGARAGLAARLHDSDPAAFRAMLADAARLLAERDPQGLAELARQLGAAEPAAASGAAKSVAQAARSAQSAPVVAQGAPAEPEALRPSDGAAFPADAYRQFASATNEAVEQQMRESIDRTLGAALPDGIASGARRRIGDDIFREVHTALSADRELSLKISELVRGWQFDAGTRQQISALLAGRARAVLPEVARRVVSEWTSAVLASDRAKNARIESAASRRDITGGRLPEPVASSALLPRRVDYARTSDEQIMEM